MAAHVLATPDMSWVVELREKLSDSKYSRVYCIAEASCSGVIGLVNSLRLERYGDRLRCLLLRDQEWDSFRLSALWGDIQEADLIMNIVSADGMVGSYRLLPVKKEPKEEEMEKEQPFSCSPDKLKLTSLLVVLVDWGWSWQLGWWKEESCTSP